LLVLPEIFCNFVSILKASKTPYYSLRNRLSAALLLLLFLGSILVPAFHSHNSAAEQGIEQTVAVDNPCAVCDYIAHSHTEVFTSIPPLILSVPLPPTIELHNGVFARIYKFTLQGFSNKGPPASSLI
jgi:hypothetical protein